MTIEAKDIEGEMASSEVIRHFICNFIPRYWGEIWKFGCLCYFCRIRKRILLCSDIIVNLRGRVNLYVFVCCPPTVIFFIFSLMFWRAPASHGKIQRFGRFFGPESFLCLNMLLLKSKGSQSCIWVLVSMLWRSDISCPCFGQLLEFKIHWTIDGRWCYSTEALDWCW